MQALTEGLLILPEDSSAALGSVQGRQAWRRNSSYEHTSCSSGSRRGAGTVAMSIHPVPQADRHGVGTVAMSVQPVPQAAGRKRVRLDLEVDF